MKLRNKIILLISVVAVLGLLLFNPFIGFKTWTPESCTTLAQPTHLCIVNYDKALNWSGQKILGEGWYTVCMSHPNDKAYGCSVTDCFGDNGTHVLTGQRYTLYDGSYHDNTEWELKSSFSGVAIAEFALPYFFMQSFIIILALMCLVAGAVFMITYQSKSGKSEEKC